MHVLLEPFQYGFLRHALVVCAFAGALCGLLGVFVTLRGMSYLGHGLSHAIFGGAAVCAAVGINFFVGAGVWGVASSLAIGRITKRRIIGSDAAIGVVTTASFAFGVALLGYFSRVKRSIEATVFGSVLGVSDGDMLLIIGVSIFTAIAVLVAYRKLLFTTFDPEVAEVSGVNVSRVDALLMLLLSLAILSSMKVLGVTLIAAAVVTPAVIARMLTNSFATMLWLSPSIGAACGLVGMYVSYHLDISSGATIVLVGFVLFAVVFAATGGTGLNRRAKGYGSRAVEVGGQIDVRPVSR
ncbi:MAG: manganese transport system permease protein [Acidimicrobiia bacterium]|jgi:manganese/iron transport system permease protein/iron/zinc/copper transport system permease protein|nr:manganese transport system permease protein [Acidimicrobiia bacterium]